MCEFCGRLITWLDRELPAEEAAEVERHLEACLECRARVDAYKRLSGDIDAYCDATLASGARPRSSPWTAVAAAVGAAAALVALLLVWSKPGVRPPTVAPVHTSVAASPAALGIVPPAPLQHLVRKVHRPQAAPLQVQNVATAPPARQSASLLLPQPVIEIAFPADEMFPPGAVPEGIHFVGDVTISADGSAERLRLRPRLAGFERSTTRP